MINFPICKFRRRYTRRCLLILCLPLSSLLLCYTLNVFIFGSPSCNVNDATSLRQEGLTVSKNDDFSQISVIVKSKNKRVKHLTHVINGFKAFSTNITVLDIDELPVIKWDIMWSYHAFTTKEKNYLTNLNRKHCVNHFPGSSFITSKVNLMKSGISSIPKSFHIPSDKEKLMKFVKENPEILFVKKSNAHRGVKIISINDLNYEESDNIFLQQFVSNPLLVDGYKFDIGVYVVITSSAPFRVYVHDEVLFRFCKDKYHPFSSSNTRKYVTGDDYRPLWDVPSLKDYYKIQKLGMKNSFNIWLRNKGKNSNEFWEKVEDIIRQVFFQHSKQFRKYHKTSSNIRFFELFRFDFVIDELFNIFLMEVNMSPNLSSAHFPENSFLYEQVVYNTLSLIGLPYKGCFSNMIETEEMLVSKRNIAVFTNYCSLHCKDETTCHDSKCRLCIPCLTDDLYQSLRLAFLEHRWRGSFKRIIPISSTVKMASEINQEKLYHNDSTLADWYRGKCFLDSSFC